MSQKYQISVRGDTYPKLTEGLPRTEGRLEKIRPGVLKRRMDHAINAALDKEQDGN